MKFTLVSPYNNFNSYGIKSISTYLRNNDISVSTVYLLSNFWAPYSEEVLDQLVELCEYSDLVGISCMSNYFMNCVQITKELKNKLKVPVVWGGVHATIAPEECLQYCDIAVIGEGEQTLLEVINSFKMNKPIRNIQGTFVRDNGKIIKNNTRPPMDVKCLPVVDNNFSSDYMLIKGKIRNLDFKMIRDFMSEDYVTLSSFGCPFSCSYCINDKLKTIYNNKVRFRKIDHVIQELVLAKEKMSFIKHVSFDDDAFINREPADLEKFAEEYKKKVNLPFFVSGFNPFFVTDEKIRILLPAGMDRVRMGIQSGSKKSKALYNRNVPNEKIIEAAKIINKYKKNLMLTGFDIILDNPFESKADTLETIELLSKLPKPFTLNLFSLTFYPGTSLYEKALSAGFIKDKIADIYRKHYHDIDTSWLNLIVLLFTIFKVPKPLLKLLLNDRLVKKDIKVPKTVFKFIKLMGFARRGLNFVLHGDPYTLTRHLKAKLVKM